MNRKREGRNTFLKNEDIQSFGKLIKSFQNSDKFSGCTLIWTCTFIQNIRVLEESLFIKEQIQLKRIIHPRTTLKMRCVLSICTITFIISNFWTQIVLAEALEQQSKYIL